MKIVNRETFLKLPSGTLYSRVKNSAHRDYDFGTLELKKETTDDDWWYIPLDDVQSENDYVDRLTTIDKMYEGEDIDNPEYSQFQDGLYDKNSLFLVWNENDKQQLIEVLKR